MTGGNGYEGGCTCGEVRYRMETAPLIVHCCHCHWCQRETGSAFALNALIEADRVTLLKGEPDIRHLSEVVIAGCAINGRFLRKGQIVLGELCRPDHALNKGWESIVSREE